jgi:hypothetical protein
MIKTLWTSAAMGALALAVAACAQTGASTTTSTASNAPSATRSQPATSANVTDAELTAFLAAREEIAPITSRYATMTSEERTQATAQIVDIQRRNNLTAARYDAISRAVQNDPALASRVLAEGFAHFLRVAVVEIDRDEHLLCANEGHNPQSAFGVRRACR